VIYPRIRNASFFYQALTFGYFLVKQKVRERRFQTALIYLSYPLILNAYILKLAYAEKMYEFGKSLMDDRHNRIFVVLSYKVIVRWALVSHTEVNHAPKAIFMETSSW